MLKKKHEKEVWIQRKVHIAILSLKGNFQRHNLYTGVVVGVRAVLLSTKE